jgi:hypothetical protein
MRDPIRDDRRRRSNHLPIRRNFYWRNTRISMAGWNIYFARAEALTHESLTHARRPGNWRVRAVQKNCHAPRGFSWRVRWKGTRRALIFIRKARDALLAGRLLLHEIGGRPAVRVSHCLSGMGFAEKSTPPGMVRPLYLKIPTLPYCRCD